MAHPRLLFTDADFERPAARSRREGLVFVLLAFLVTRLLVWTAAYMGAFTNFRIELQLDPPFEKHTAALMRKLAVPDNPTYWLWQERLADFAPLLNFDGRHYASIIAGGYAYEDVGIDAAPREREQNIAFFPLFPLLAWPLAAFLSTAKAMILTVHALTLAAAICLYLWVRERTDEHTARYAVLAQLCIPAACYFSFGYAEAATLLFTVLALWAADFQRWWWAAIFAGIATGSRPTALAVAAVVLLSYWFVAPGSRRDRLTWIIPLGLISGTGIALYALFLTVQYGSPFVYLDNFRTGWVRDEIRSDWFEYVTMARVWDQFKYFGRMLRELPVGLLHAANPFTWNMPQNFFILFLSFAGLGRVPRSFRPFLLLGPLIFLHAYLASGGASFGVEPIGRYMGVATPAFIVLAAWMVREWSAGWRHALLGFMLLIQLAWAFRFGLDEWSG